MEIRRLREGDDRRNLPTGDPDLDRFFQRYAGQNQFEHYVGVTHVAVEKRTIVGFVTVAPGHVEIEDLPVPKRKRLPQYPLPILRLARLAVDQSVRGQGVGTALLKLALGLTIRMATDYGCIGVVVDAKKDAVPFYRRSGFIQLDLLEGSSQARPEPLAMFLSTREIVGALAK